MAFCLFLNVSLEVDPALCLPQVWESQYVIEVIKLRVFQVEPIDSPDRLIQVDLVIHGSDGDGCFFADGNGFLIHEVDRLGSERVN